jgi:two-component system nitrate/nitrite response regulator NarL
MIRVLVATGVRAYHDGLQRVLLGAEGIALVGTVSTPELAVEETCKLLPSVLLLDIDMAKRLALHGQIAGTPGVRGIVLLGRPETYADVIVCLPADVLAFVAHEATVAHLLSAIRAAGGVEQPAVQQPASAIPHLTDREMEILRLIREGLPNKIISRELGIELSTVKNHVHSILTKLGAHSRNEATSLLYRYETGDGALTMDQPAVA